MISTLHIKTAIRNNVTYLDTAFFSTPFKVANITEDKKAHLLQLMLMSSSPGILDGDQYQLKIEVQDDCSLQLHTQSYQRLFNMKQSASQTLEVYLLPGASFCFLPHPSVPHAKSVFRSVNKLYISGNCSLVFGEIITCGRKLNGEVFLFSKYHNTTEVYLDNKLIIKENLLIEPSTINLKAIGQLEGFTHQASFIYLNSSADINATTKVIINFLNKQNGIVFGVTAAPINGLLVKILGHKAEQLYNCLHAINSFLSRQATYKSIAHAV